MVQSRLIAVKHFEQSKRLNFAERFTFKIEITMYTEKTLHDENWKHEGSIEGSGKNKKILKSWRSRLRRREKVQRITDASVRQWRHSHKSLLEAHSSVPEPSTRNSASVVLRSLPRPRGLGAPHGIHSALPPRRHEEKFKAGLWRSLGRLLLWMIGACRFLFGVVADRLRGLDKEERRAWRLRITFEKMGTTFIKFGQQLSMRLDLIPYTYTRELEKMLDKVPAFPTGQAIRTIERASGKPLDQIFAAFDPDPIGSASIACVYQAVLKNGERVAVKVRRPGIGELLAADMRALEWLLKLAELVVLTPGFTANFIVELRTMLMEELDFVREARFTDIFRRSLRKTKQLDYASTPRVFFEYSGVDVLVTEFVSGVWLTDVLTALETKDRCLLAKIEEMNIDPIILARRFLLVSRFGNFEHIFFHADLHPANILVQPGNKIILIDFGSCGSFTDRELASWRRLFDAQSLDDVSGMVQAALGVIEPLPPIDKDQFALRVEQMFFNDLYAIKSKHSEWWERISAKLWIGFLKLAREFQIPMRLNLLRMIRGIMLADTIAARLDNDLDPYKEYRFYEKGAGKRAKKSMKKTLRRLSGPAKYIRIQQGMESVLNTIYQAQRILHSVASIRLLPAIGKAILTFFQLAKAAILVATSASTIALFRVLIDRLTGEKLPFFHVFYHAFWEVFKNGYFQIYTLCLILPILRRIRVRLDDPEY
jgi:ubiquinone biosynthesis protein